MEKVVIFYGHLEYITAIWYISCPFGNLVAIWYIFPRFGILCQYKSGNPGHNNDGRPTRFCMLMLFLMARHTYLRIRVTRVRLL
jgi:hypothetical protein